MPHDSFKDFPCLETSSTINPQPPLSFSTVIDQDHSQINAAALQLRDLLSPKQTQRPQLRKQQLELLHFVTWRLIRHDISEDIIMRPAFAHYLGDEGKAMSERDREDHGHARKELLDLYTAFEALPAGDIETLKRLRQRYVDLMNELAEHMKTESGTDITRLESILGRSESEELGRKYLRTQLLGPELRLQGRKVWGDVGAYISESTEGFWKVWREIENAELKRDSKF